MRKPRLMAVLARPDDESLGAGGTLANRSTRANRAEQQQEGASAGTGRRPRSEADQR